MGNQVSIDRHTTPLEEWFQLSTKLDSIPFEEDISPHVTVWSVSTDENNPQEINCKPVSLNISQPHTLVSPHQAFIVLAIRNNRHIVNKTNLAVLVNLVHAIKQHIQANSAKTPIISGVVGSHEYSVYAYLGKLCQPKTRLVAIGLALKMDQLLDSANKMAILGGGGVLRGSKLQKGSTQSLLCNAPPIEAEVMDYQQIALFSFFWKEPRGRNPLLSYQSNRSSPFIACESTSVKPPMLILKMKPFEQATYSEIQNEQNNGEINLDIRTTARHQLKMQKFRGQCNEIQDCIYVGGEMVAKDLSMLQSKQIKWVINCAGDYCQNWHEGKGIGYLTFFLKDSQHQNIECLFYRAIDFIQNCQKNKENVLVHCIQGISRSVTIVVAYLIFKLGYDFKKAEQLVKQKRGISCPNNGFMVELIQFHKRLYEPYASLPIPRVFLVSSHSPETPSIITARMIKHTLFDSRRYIALDCRGIYIIQAPEIVYIWVGSKCQQKRLQNYWSYAQEYVKKLQKFQRASIKLKAVSQGTEGKDFLSLWNIQEAPLDYENSEYNRLFCEGETAKTGGMRKYFQRQVEEQEQEQRKLFLYPDAGEGLGVFQFQDLGGLSILSVSQGATLKLFVCRDDNFQIEEDAVGEFLERVIKTHYSSTEPSGIQIEEENVDSPSEEFVKHFS